MRCLSLPDPLVPVELATHICTIQKKNFSLFNHKTKRSVPPRIRWSQATLPLSGGHLQKTSSQLSLQLPRKAANTEVIITSPPQLQGRHPLHTKPRRRKAKPLLEVQQELLRTTQLRALVDDVGNLHVKQSAQKRPKPENPKPNRGRTRIRTESPNSFVI